MLQAFPNLVDNVDNRSNLSWLKGLMGENEFEAVKKLLKDDVHQQLHGKSAEDKGSTAVGVWDAI